MAVERIERSLDALLLVALLGDGEILDPRQGITRRRLRAGPGLLLHSQESIAYYAAASARLRPRTAQTAKPPMSPATIANAAKTSSGRPEMRLLPASSSAVTGLTL